jgi:hypothetical protein
LYLHAFQAAVLKIVRNKSYRRCPPELNLHTCIHTYIHTHTHTHTQANNIICTKLQKPTLIYVARLHFVLEYSQPSYTKEQLKYSQFTLHFRDRNNSHQNNRKLRKQLRKICRWKRKETNDEKPKTRNKFPPSFQVYSSPSNPTTLPKAERRNSRFVPQLFSKLLL